MDKIIYCLIPLLISARMCAFSFYSFCFLFEWLMIFKRYFLYLCFCPLNQFKYTRMPLADMALQSYLSVDVSLD